MNMELTIKHEKTIYSRTGAKQKNTTNTRKIYIVSPKCAIIKKNNIIITDRCRDSLRLETIQWSSTQTHIIKNESKIISMADHPTIRDTSDTPDVPTTSDDIRNMCNFSAMF